MNNQESTRPTVGRVKPLLELHRLCARDAIMIPYRGWIWTPPLDSGILLTWTSSIFHKVPGLGVEFLNLRHLIEILRYLASPLLKFSVD